MSNSISLYDTSFNIDDCQTFSYLSLHSNARISAIQDFFKVSDQALFELEDDDFLLFFEKTIELLKEKNHLLSGNIDLDEDSVLIFKYYNKAIVDSAMMLRYDFDSKVSSYKKVISEAFKLPKEKRMNLTIDEFIL